jgi:peptide/nickel transport system permease protein
MYFFKYLYFGNAFFYHTGNVITLSRKILNKLKKGFTHPYTKFVGKKGAFYLVVIIVSLTFTWAVPRYMPGNPINALLQPPPTGLSQDARDNWMEIQNFIIEEFGLNKSIGEQYLDFWRGILRLDFGTSYRHQEPVLGFMIPYMLFTMSLVIPVLFISFQIGNWIGAKVAFMEGKKSKFIYYLLIFVQSAPFYWLGLIFYVIFISELKLFPTYGAWDPEYIPGLPGNILSDVGQFLYHYASPFLALLISQTGGWATGMRAMTLYEKDSEYLLYAQQLGFKQNLIRRYAKRNAILPQVTGLNMNLNALIGQTIILEALFGWPGLGSMNISALGARDYPLIVGGFLITLLIVVVGNFLLDILYGFIDPRIRTGARS